MMKEASLEMLHHLMRSSFEQLAISHFFSFFLLSFGSMYKILDYFLSFPKTLDTIHKICNTINFRARLNLFLEGVLQCYFLLSLRRLVR